MDSDMYDTLCSVYIYYILISSVNPETGVTTQRLF